MTVLCIGNNTHATINTWTLDFVESKCDDKGESGTFFVYSFLSQTFVSCYIEERSLCTTYSCGNVLVTFLLESLQFSYIYDIQFVTVIYFIHSSIAL